MPALKVSWKWISLLFIVFSLVLQWYAHTCGLLVTNDSLHYMSAAISFTQSHQLINKDGTSYVNWPPLYPILLSFFDEPLTAIRWVNYLVTLVVGIMLAQFSEKMIGHKGLRSVYLFSLLCGVHLIMNAVFLWSEMIFMLLSVFFLHYFQKVKVSNHAGIISMLLGILLCLQRNAGLFIVSGAVLWYLFTDTTSWRFRIGKACLLFLIGTSGFWLWNLWISYGQTSTFKIQEQEFFIHMGHNLGLISRALITAYVPVKSWSILLLIIFVCVIAVVVKQTFRDNALLQLMSFVVISYVAGMTFLFRIDYDADNDRYVSMILPYVGLIAFSALDKVLMNRTRVIKTIAIVLLVLWLGYPLSRTIRNVIQWHNTSCSIDNVSTE